MSSEVAAAKASSSHDSSSGGRVSFPIAGGRTFSVEALAKKGSKEQVRSSSKVAAAKASSSVPSALETSEYLSSLTSVADKGSFSSTDPQCPSW